MSTRRRSVLPGTSKKISSWVRPGVCETRTSALRPVSALIRLDLPTLERPAKAISSPRAFGSVSTELAADANCHSCANRRRPASISAEENSDAALTVGRLEHVDHFPPVLNRLGRHGRACPGHPRL